MEGLILLAILIPGIIIILLFSILRRSNEQGRLLESLYDKLKDLRNDLSALSADLKQKEKEPVIAVQPLFKEQPAKDLVPEKPQVLKEKPVIPAPKPITPKKPEVILPKQELPAPKPSAQHAAAEKSTTPAKQEEVKDLEKYIGETLISRIGIAILILGISFFIKYAIDKNWINESGRVMTGFICGAVLMFIAHRLRNTYRSFSSVLVGGALTVFYFSTAFAFHEYGLIGQTAAFLIMVVITGFAVFLSIYYDRLELAILAVIGGFITPFLASTGNANYNALFVYLCILNSGIIILSWYKRWPSINSIALFFTTAIFGVWLFQQTMATDESFPKKDALLFAIVFYLLFTVMHIINNLRMQRKFAAFDFMMVLGTNGLFYLAGMIILDYTSRGEGLFTFLLGGFNLLLAFLFYRHKTIDRNFVSLLLGLAISFISLSIPVQFNGNVTVLFWAAESVILLYLFRRTTIRLLFYASLVTTCLFMAGLVTNWTRVYFIQDNIIPILFNKGFITAFFAGMATLASYLLLRQKTPAIPNSFSPVVLKNAACVLTISVFFLTGLLEIYYQFSTRIPTIPVHFLYMQLYTFIAALVVRYIFRNSTGYPVLKTALTFLCAGIYLTGLYQTKPLAIAIAGTTQAPWFIVHWLAAAILLWMLLDLLRFFFRGEGKKWVAYKETGAWVLCTAILVLLSAELYQANIWANLHDGNYWTWWNNLYYKAGLSILWGLFSFALMWAGMKYNQRVLRVISLTMFSITIAKLFIYDIRNIPPGGKIAAFVLLGVLLLVVSFMYQRLKKIILNNDTE